MKVKEMGWTTVAMLAAVTFLAAFGVGALVCYVIGA